MKKNTLRNIIIFIVVLLAYFAIDNDSIICWLFAMIAAVLAVGVDIMNKKD